MKNLILALFVFMSAYAANRHRDPPSTHGMLVLGQSKIYLSHLPMFHSPHDYQVILEAEFDSAALKAYRANPAPYHTIEPEMAVLEDLARVGQRFQAKLFAGHFERGGKPLGLVTVKVTRVLHFTKFDPLAVKPAFMEVLLFGNAQEQFAAHVIRAKPDYDQVSAVDVRTDLNLGPQLTAVPQLPNRPLKEGVKTSDFKVLRNIYTETGDLSF